MEFMDRLELEALAIRLEGPGEDSWSSWIQFHNVSLRPSKAQICKGRRCLLPMDKSVGASEPVEIKIQKARNTMLWWVEQQAL